MAGNALIARHACLAFSECAFNGLHDSILELSIGNAFSKKFYGSSRCPTCEGDTFAGIRDNEKKSKEGIKKHGSYRVRTFGGFAGPREAIWRDPPAIGASKGKGPGSFTW